MLSAKDFQGAAKVLASRDIVTIAGYLGCQVATVRAVLEVESRGSGFDGHGRPKMLFEPHVFYRELGPGSARDRAVALGLAYAKWGARPYPVDSYPVLFKAMAINETAALRSASWGLHQGMGFNHQIMGFPTVQDYVMAMTYSESAQLYAMARFIVGKGIQGHLRNLLWSSFAKVYNGASYAKHGYHTKLKQAYEHRPQSERYTPPPATPTQLAELLRAPETVVVSDDMVPVPEVKKHHWLEIVIGMIVAGGATLIGYFVLGD